MNVQALRGKVRSREVSERKQVGDVESALSMPSGLREHKT